MISLDTLRADRVGFLGCAECRTPNLDAIARESLYFTKAYTNAYFTTPSHMTVFTSLYTNTHHVESRGIPLRDRLPLKSGPSATALAKKYVTLAEILTRAGYHSEWHGPLNSKFLSFNDGFGRGFEIRSPSPFARGLDFGTYKFNQFDVSSLRALNGHTPAFLFLHTYLPHLPYFLEPGPAPYTKALLDDFAHNIANSPAYLVEQAGQALSAAEKVRLIQACTHLENISSCFHDKFSSDPFWHAVGSWQLLRLSERFRAEPNEKFEVRKAYDSNVAEMDKQIGQLWRKLEEQGALKNSLVVFFSDHGQELFEHGTVFHNSFYEHTARVPVIIHHPALKAGAASAQLVSLIDLMPAILSALQIASPAQTQGHAPWEKVSPYVFGSSLGSDFATDGEWKLLRAPNGKEELYNLTLDPTEHENLIGFENFWTIAAYKRLREARTAWELEQLL